MDYRAPQGGVYRPRNARASALYQCAERHLEELRTEGRLQRLVEERVIERFLECGDPHHGFARVYCPGCRQDYLLAFSCKARYFCPSCHQKRVLAYGEWVEGNVLAPAPHRQYVFTMPRLLRPIFSRRRGLLAKLCHIVERLLIPAYSAAGVEDAAGRMKLAQYMLRAPMSLEKMTYLPDTAMVMYRSRMHKGLKRNFQLMPAAQWLEMLSRHIPDRFEHLVRYVGWYSTRCRGERARAEAPAIAEQAPDEAAVIAPRARSAWARLIHKVYEVDPLECPKCKGPMQVIALIEDTEVIRRILEHLGRWSPRGKSRAPPAKYHDAGEPVRASRELTYHPVPDIA